MISGQSRGFLSNKRQSQPGDGIISVRLKLDEIEKSFAPKEP